MRDAGVVWAKPERVPLDLLARLVRIFGLGELPRVLAPVVGWRPAEDERRLDSAIREECGRRGWLDGRGRLDIDVETALRVLCRPGRECYGWINDGRVTRGVLAASVGRNAMLAIGDADSVSLRHVSANALAARLVAQAPDVPPGAGAAVTVRRSEVLAHAAGTRRSGTVRVRPPSADVRWAAATAAAPTTGSGELWVAARDRGGRRREVNPVSYVDTKAGRYLVATKDVGGDTEVLLAPATARGLAARLNEAHRLLLR